MGLFDMFGSLFAQAPQLTKAQGFGDMFNAMNKGGMMTAPGNFADKFGALQATNPSAVAPSLTAPTTPSTIDKLKDFGQNYVKYQAINSLMGGGQQQKQPLQPPVNMSGPVAPPNTSGTTGSGGGGKNYSFTPQQLDSIGNLDPKIFQSFSSNGFFDSFLGE